MGQISKPSQGLRIRAIRKALNVTQANFGQIFLTERGSTVSLQHTYRWEAGTLEITAPQIESLKDTLKDPREWVKSLVVSLQVQSDSPVPLLRPWFDPRDDQGLDRLIDAIKLPMEDADWLAWLARCHPPTSKKPLKALLSVIPLLAGIRPGVEATRSDIKTHGLKVVNDLENTVHRDREGFYSGLSARNEVLDCYEILREIGKVPTALVPAEGAMAGCMMIGPEWATIDDLVADFQGKFPFAATQQGREGFKIGFELGRQSAQKV